MSLPELARLAGQTRQAIDSFGELPYASRVALREGVEAEVGGGWQGQLAWARLERSAALRVRHFWDGAFRSDDAPWVLLEEAFSRLQERRPVADLEAQLDIVYTDVVDKHYEAEDFRTTYAGFSAWAASNSILHPEQVQPADGGSEIEAETTSWSAAYYASLAACGGATWEGDEVADRDQRRAFWEWYLAELPRTVLASP